MDQRGALLSRGSLFGRLPPVPEDFGQIPFGDAMHQPEDPQDPPSDAGVPIQPPQQQAGENMEQRRSRTPESMPELEDNMNSDAYTLKWDNHPVALLSGFNEMRKERTLIDVTLFVQDQVFHAHKAVLVRCSKYFHRLILESRHAIMAPDQSHLTVVIESATPSQMSTLLDYMYNGEVTVNQSELSGVLRAAETYGIHGLIASSARSGAGAQSANGLANEEAHGSSLANGNPSPPPNGLQNNDIQPSTSVESAMAPTQNPPPSVPSGPPPNGLQNNDIQPSTSAESAMVPTQNPPPSVPSGPVNKGSSRRRKGQPKSLHSRAHCSPQNVSGNESPESQHAGTSGSSPPSENSPVNLASASCSSGQRSADNSPDAPLDLASTGVQSAMAASTALEEATRRSLQEVAGVVAEIPAGVPSTSTGLFHNMWMGQQSSYPIMQPVAMDQSQHSSSISVSEFSTKESVEARPQTPVGLPPPMPGLITPAELNEALRKAYIAAKYGNPEAYNQWLCIAARAQPTTASLTATMAASGIMSSAGNPSGMTFVNNNTAAGSSSTKAQSTSTNTASKKGSANNKKPKPSVTCEICGKRLADPSSLYRHRKIHYGDKPHECEFCGRKFIQRYNMTQHIKTHFKQRGINSLANNPLVFAKFLAESRDENLTLQSLTLRPPTGIVDNNAGDTNMAEEEEHYEGEEELVMDESRDNEPQNDDDDDEHIEPC